MTSTSTGRGLFRAIGWWKALEFGLWVVLAVVAAVIFSLSLEPWFAFADHLVGKDTDLILLRWLTHLPFFGGAIAAALTTPIKVVGFALFAFFNACQITFLLMQSNSIKLSGDLSWKVSVLAMCGTISELFVAAASHPPYQGGMGSFLWDLARFQVDPYYINYGEIMAIAALLFAFECFVWLGIVLIFAIRTAHRQRRNG